MVPTYFLIKKICSPALGEERSTTIVVISYKKKKKIKGNCSNWKEKMTRDIKKGDWGAVYPDRAVCTGKGSDGADVFYIIVNSTVV
jgi:hypothetical protein